MRATVGGADQCNGGSVVYSTQATSNEATRGFDNDYTSSKWTTNAVSTGYIGYNFTSPVEVLQIVITGPVSGQDTYAPKDFTVEYSDDGVVWIETNSFTGETSWSALEARAYSAYAANFSGNITESLAITDWRVTATRCSDGVSVGSATTSGATYSVNVSTIEPCLIHLAPKIDFAWSTAKVVALNDYCVPVAPDTTPRLFKATDIGSVPHETHATTEPTWPSSGTVVDNDITWTFIANLVDPISLGPKIPS